LENISFATSGSNAGGADFTLGDIAPRPNIPRVELRDHPSGISSWIFTYLVLAPEQIDPTDLIID
jgi:hypothetical protein